MEKQYMATWHLENVELSAKENPDSFFIPPEEERTNRREGQLVKLVFVLDNPSSPEDPRAERMWVEVSKEMSPSSPSLSYSGILTNDPLHIKDLSAGDIIKFKPEHIAEVILEKGDPRWIDSGNLAALVSKMALEKGSLIRFLYREDPDNERDSGWRMLTGLETDEYNEDAENIKIVNVGWLLNRDPSLLYPLKNGTPGDAFERNSEHDEWVRVTDWAPME
jgi:hypothetical protein